MTRPDEFDPLLDALAHDDAAEDAEIRELDRLFSKASRPRASMERFLQRRVVVGDSAEVRFAQPGERSVGEVVHHFASQTRRTLTEVARDFELPMEVMEKVAENVLLFDPAAVGRLSKVLALRTGGRAAAINVLLKDVVARQLGEVVRETALLAARKRDRG